MRHSSTRNRSRRGHTWHWIATLTVAAAWATACGKVDSKTGPDGGTAPDGGGQGQFVLAVNVSGDGAVTLTPPGLVCAADCQQSYPPGTEVTITVAPADGMFHRSSSGACTQPGPCTVTMDQDQSVSIDLAPAVLFATLAAGDDSSVAVTRAGLPYVFLHADSDTTPDLGAIHCTDALCSNFTLRRISKAGDTGHDPTVVLDENDQPWVSYMSASPFFESHLRHCNNLSCSDNLFKILDFEHGTTRGISMVLDADGHPQVVFADKAIDPDHESPHEVPTISVSSCQDSACQTVARLNPLAVDAGRMSMFRGLDGLPVIAFHDNSDKSLRFIHCDISSCGMASTVTIDGDPNNPKGSFVAAAKGSDGLPFIAYYDDENRDLKTAKCNDPACSEFPTFHTIDGADTNVGGHVSMVIPSDGRPVIAYYDATNGDLKVARCDDAECSTAEIHTVASAGNVGRYTSMALDPDELPVIVYQDINTRILHLARCQTPSCGG